MFVYFSTLSTVQTVTSIVHHRLVGWAKLLEKSGLRPGHTLKLAKGTDNTGWGTHTQAYSGLRPGYTLPTQVRQCTRVLSGSGAQADNRHRPGAHTGLDTIYQQRSGSVPRPQVGQGHRQRWGAHRHTQSEGSRVPGRNPHKNSQSHKIVSCTTKLIYAYTVYLFPFSLLEPKQNTRKKEEEKNDKRV